MTITLTMEEEWELWEEAERNSRQKLELEPFEVLSEMPRQIGKGYIRNIELYPQLWLAILDYEYHDDVLFKSPNWDHPLQFLVLLSGRNIDEYGGQVGEGYTCISGSGVQRKMLVRCPKSRYVGVDIHMSPDLLRTFFPTKKEKFPPNCNCWQRGTIGRHCSTQKSQQPCRG